VALGGVLASRIDGILRAADPAMRPFALHLTGFV